MAKVLRIINRFNLGGPTYNASNLTKYLPSRFETLLIGGAKDDSEESSLHIPHGLGLQPRILESMRRDVNLFSDYHALQEITQIIREYRPDIVHTHASKAGFLGRIAAIREKVPVIIHTFHGHVFHGYFPWWKTNIYKTIERQLARRTDAIVAISQLQKTELTQTHRICKPDRIEVIPLGFDLEKFSGNTATKRAEFRKMWQLEDDEVAVGIIGRLVPIKDHHTFLKAFARAAGESKKLRGFIIGDGEMRSTLESAAGELNLLKSGPGGITFTSWIREVDHALAGLDLVMLTSLNEGTPVSLIEAQAAGKPLISTRVGGVADIMLENTTGLLADPKDAETLASHLSLLAADARLREAMGKAGQEFASGRFTSQRLSADMAALYDRLLTR